MILHWVRPADHRLASISATCIQDETNSTTDSEMKQILDNKSERDSPCQVKS